jgi:uncharacterized protein (TIGR02444 family)
MTDPETETKTLVGQTVSAPEKVPGLWAFSLALYARPGVAAACLALQDRFGADVNLLLLGFWRAAKGYAGWATAELDHATDAIAPVNAVLKPFRESRRALKRLLADEPAAAPLYDEAKALELRLEQVAQAWLAAVSRVSPATPRPLPLSHVDHVEAAATHLSQYLQRIAPDDPLALQAAADLLGAALRDD